MRVSIFFDRDGSEGHWKCYHPQWKTVSTHYQFAEYYSEPVSGVLFVASLDAPWENMIAQVLSHERAMNIPNNKPTRAKIRVASSVPLAADSNL